MQSVFSQSCGAEVSQSADSRAWILVRGWFRAWILVAVVLGASVQAAEPTPLANLSAWLDHLQRVAPVAATQFDGTRSEQIVAAADAVEQWAAHAAWNRPQTDADAVVVVARHLLATRQRSDALLESVIALRSQLAEITPSQRRREAICDYLRSTEALLQLSGRLQYQLIDTLHAVRSSLPLGQATAHLLDLADEFSSPLVCNVAALDLLPDPALDDPAAEPTGPIDTAARARLLELIARTRQHRLLPQLAHLLRHADSPATAVAAAWTIREVGLPQVPRPNPIEQLPEPAITPPELQSVLRAIDTSQLDATWSPRHAELLAWIAPLASEGLTADEYRVGSLVVRPGDWLLMRNPSPYNLFSDLSPGLFTHVGVVALESGDDGIRRMVIVDLPERGARIPATNVETYVERTLSYAFLRHPDPQVAQAMGRAAEQVIGNPAHFDLNFRTDRVLSLRGADLRGQTVHTYCAGLLLLCAIQSDAPREVFFPIAEYPSSGRTLENFATLGLAVGDDMISPTGALFSNQLQLVGRNEPLYDPRREVEESIFNHFAQAMATKKLTPSPDVGQALRQKLAESAQGNPLLAQALAAVNGVSAQIDLVAAAKAAAVIETLDEIAFGRSDDFLAAREAITCGSLDDLVAEGWTADEIAMMRDYRTEHQKLYDAYAAGRLTPRQLRIELVRYYSAQGIAQLDQRFFSK